MTQYLLDTNILLRASDPNSSSYPLIMNVVDMIIRQGGECLITSQILIEFWVVATRYFSPLVSISHHLQH